MFRRVAFPAHYWALLCIYAPVFAIAIFAILVAVVVGSDAREFIIAAAKWRFGNVLGASGNALDSWLPMIKAVGVLHGPNPDTLYETLFFDQKIRFQYPPTSLLPFEILRQFDLLTVKFLNSVNLFAWTSIAAVMATISFVLFRQRALDGSAGRLDHGICDWRWMAVGAIGATFLFHPIIDAYALGQIQVWIDLAFAIACLGWLLDRRALAGICVAVACAIKPQFALLLIWGIAWQQWRFVAGFLALIVPAGLLGLFLYGWHNHIAYIEVLAYISGHDEAFFNNNSVNGILTRLLVKDGSVWSADSLLSPGNPYVAAGTTIALLAFTLIGIGPALLRRAREANVLDFAAATLCFVMAAPIAWTHHYGVVLPFFLIALKAVLDSPRSLARNYKLVMLAIAWILLANALPFVTSLHGPPLNILQSYRFFGGLLLLAVLIAESGTWRDLVTSMTRRWNALGWRRLS